MARFVVGVSGASGVVLAHRAVTFLADAGHEVVLIFSRSAKLTASLEMGEAYGSPTHFISHLSEASKSRVEICGNQDFSAGVASGSMRTAGMLVIPCSMATLAAIAIGLSDNLLRRAAEVTLKERRPLVVVPREAPLTEANLENMVKVVRMGGTILPPVPAWYTRPKTVEEIEQFIVGRALDQLRVDNDLYPRWGSC